MDDHELEIHYAEEWAALYVDGKLMVVGDSYLAEERAFQLLGVKQIHDDAFMRGQTSRDGVAQTVDAVIAYRADRQAREDKASKLREEAKLLLAEAAALVPEEAKERVED